LKTDSPIFAILRHKRIKFWNNDKPKPSPGSDAKGALKHQVRLFETQNADSERFADNLVVCAQTNWRPESLAWIPPGAEKSPWLSANFLEKEAKALIQQLGIQAVRSDATCLEEILMSISPDWFRDGDIFKQWNPVRVTQFVEAITAYILERYPGIVIAIIVHLDESTPHASAFILPAIRRQITKRGALKKGENESDRPSRMGWKLCASKLFASRECVKNQTAYAKFLQSRGLDVRRGIEGSRTTHVTMAVQRKLMNTPVPELPSFSVPTEKEAAPMLKTGQTYAEFITEYAANKFSEVKGFIDKLHGKAVDRDQAVQRKIEYQLTASDMQEKLQGLQNRIAPVSVVEALRRVVGTIGAKNYLYETFHTPVGLTVAVNLEDDTFRTGWGGADVKGAKVQRGTLKAICLVTGLSKEWGAWWLATQFGLSRAGATLALTTPWNLPDHDPIPSGISLVREQCVVPSAATWPTLKRELEEKYGLPESYLEQKLKQGVIGANEFGALLFEKQDIDGKVLGAVVATDVPGYVHQFDRCPEEPGVFRLGESAAKKLFITDTPLLALLIEYCLQKLNQSDCSCVSLLACSEATDISMMMQDAQEVRLVLRTRREFIQGHEKLINIPAVAETIHLGDPNSNHDFFWTMVKEGYSGFQILNKISRKLFGRDVAPSGHRDEDITSEEDPPDNKKSRGGDEMPI
jgi:hypothetical protein